MRRTKVIVVYTDDREKKIKNDQIKSSLEQVMQSLLATPSLLTRAEKEEKRERMRERKDRETERSIVRSHICVVLLNYQIVFLSTKRLV